jgi:hypothetical protein
MANTLHANQDSKHLVAVNALRVVILPDSVGYLAQGVEIDYFAAGTSETEAMDSFQKGFALTVAAHLKKFGNLVRFLKSRPSVLEQFSDQKEFWEFSQVSFHELPLENSKVSFPYDCITFARPKLTQFPAHLA